MGSAIHLSTCETAAEPVVLWCAVMAATLAAARDAIVGGVPLGRIGSPEDVAGACIFLSSRAGAWVNG